MIGKGYCDLELLEKYINNMIDSIHRKEDETGSTSQSVYYCTALRDVLGFITREKMIISGADAFMKDCIRACREVHK